MKDGFRLETVLIVDDNPLFLRTFARSWSPHVGAVRTAGSVDEALQVLEKQGVDLLIVDLFLGTRSGLWLIGTVRERYPLIPVVLMSGGLEIDHAVDAIRVGAVDAIKKGMLPEQILTRLGRTDDPAARSYRPTEQPRTLHANERRFIDDALTRTGGNEAAASRLLGIHRTTLRRKLQKTPES